MGPNFDGFNHPDPIQKLQKPAITRHPMVSPSSPGAYDRPQSKARLLNMYLDPLAWDGNLHVPKHAKDWQK